LEAIVLSVPTVIAGLLAIVWLLSTTAFVWLIRSLVKLVVDKTSAEDLPKILDSLTPLLGSLARVVLRHPAAPRDPYKKADPDRTLEP
jgi:hypothetical protein